MLEKNPVHVWKETLSAKPATRETFKGMHLAVLHQATRQKLGEHLLHIQFETHDFILCELKGRPNELTAFPLPQKEEKILWLGLQFQGTLSFPTGKVSQPDTIFSFTVSEEENLLTVAVEKQWMLLLGITGASRQQLMAEQPRLRTPYDPQQNGIMAAMAISYYERKVLEQFSKKTFGPFTTVHHIGLALGELYTAYMQQLDKQGGQDKEEGLVQLYHRAISYITAHYLDEQLNLEKVAAACHCSVRNITRAFQGRPASITRSILLIRLYKGRELLHERPELTIEQIAGILHFSDAKHFANHYKKHFHRTPRDEQKAIISKRSHQRV